MAETEFHEIQRPPRPLVLILAAMAAATLGLLVAAPIEPGEAERWPTFLMVVALGAALFAALRMETRVDADGILVRTLFVWTRRIRLDEVETAEAVRYRPLRDYGGWGVRIGPRGKAYTMRGTEGVQLTLSGGRRVLIGSERAVALADAIKAHR